MTRDDSGHITDTAIDIFERFEIELSADGLQQQDDPFDELRSILAQKIRYLIDRDIDKLKQALYRIDVNEQQVKHVLAESPLDEAVDEIAAMIINRQLEKVKTRKKYSQPGGNDLSWDIEP